MSCGGAAPCARLISISAIRGGNPTAKAEPDAYASEWTKCARCGHYTCDRCLARQSGNCKCGSASPLFSDDQRIQIAHDLMLGGASAGPQAIAVARVTPPSAADDVPPPPSRLGAEISSLDASSKQALWVTLAFLEVALADGKVVDAEVAAWKATMERMNLPDVWQRFGVANLKAMLERGTLQEISISYAALAPESRAKLATVLVEFMLADGQADATEIATIKRIGGWLGVNLEIGVS
jgi:uncharacterized tellurite resistance protein B-like protein